MGGGGDKGGGGGEYRAKEANYGPGILAAVVAAAAAGTIWGEFATWAEVGSGKWYPYLHAAVTFPIGMLVCWALFKATGKKDRAGQVVAILLTLAAKWWGDALYYGHAIAYVREVPFTGLLVLETLKKLFPYKLLTGPPA